MTRGRFKLARVDFSSKLEERPWVLSEVVDVKHGLGVGQVWEIDSKAGVDTVSASEVRDTT